MNTTNKLNKLKAAESDFNAARDFRGAAWDAYTAAEKVYGDARTASDFINAARDAAQIDYIAAGEALKTANEVSDAAWDALNTTTATD